MQIEKRKNILIVDDEALCTYIAKSILSEHYNVETVTNGYEALEIIKTRHFDLVLVDINLGDERMDGIRVMRRIRQENKYRRTKLVAVTAYSDMRDWYISEGFDDFFMKPFVGPDALKLVNDIMGQPDHKASSAA